MRRLLRWCSNGLCLLSLLACVGVAWLWRDGWRRQPGVVWDRTTRVSEEGRFVERWELEAYCARGGLLAEAARWRYSFAALRGNGFDPLHWPDQREVNPWRDLPPGPYPAIDPDYRGSRSRDFVGAGGLQVCAVGLSDPPACHGFAAVLPCWFLVAVTLPPPLLWFASRSRRLIVRRRRRRLGQCLRCGYDPTGNTSGVCPECGAAVEAGRRVTA